MCADDDVICSSLGRMSLALTSLLIDKSVLLFFIILLLQDVDDQLLESRTPTLFVLGQQATACRIDDIEDMREKMKAENGLILVGGTDDMLRISKTKKKQEAITQSMVDRCIQVNF
jgi:hypothetical protein